MGGIGSGRRFNVDDGPALSKVLEGPWGEELPPPTVPLNEYGEKKYYDVIRMLFDGGRLTYFARDQAEQYAILAQQIHDETLRGEKIPTNRFNALDRARYNLRLEDEKRPIANRAADSQKFKGMGLINKNRKAVRLLRPAEANPRNPRR